MRLRQKKVLLGKVLLLVVMLLVITSGLSGLSCIRGLQPVGWSGGVVADGKLFVGSEEGRLVAINLADDGRQWSEQLKASAQAGGFGCVGPAGGGGCAGAPAGVAIYGTPAVGDDLVYIGGYNGKVYAFDSNSLAVQWIYPREDNLEPIISGLAISQNKVYFGATDEEDKELWKLYALNAETGNKEWEFEMGDKIWSTPVIDGDTLYIGCFDKKLYAIDTTTGKEKWEPFETEGAIAATPLVYNNTVYVGSFDRHLYAVDATTGKQIWRFPVSDEGENNPENWFWAKPVAYNNVIYAPCLDGKVYALDAQSGDKLDEFDLGSPASASPVMVNSSVIFASRQGVIYKLDTSSKALRQLANVEKEVYGPLSVNEGIVYVHTQDMTLHRIDTETGAIKTISLKSSE